MAAARDVRKVIASTAPDPFDLIDRIVGYSNVLAKECFAEADSERELSVALNGSESAREQYGSGRANRRAGTAFRRKRQGEQFRCGRFRRRRWLPADFRHHGRCAGADAYDVDAE